MSAELSEAMRQLDGDEAVRAIVLTGEGRMFCSGTDLSGKAATWKDQDDWPEDGQSHRSLRTLRTPVIAAINGACVGAGMAIALECDIRIAAEDAKLGFVFSRRGIIADGAQHWWLPRLIGASRALELLLTGRIVSGAEAVEYGLVSKTAAREQTLATAYALAEEIARFTSPLSVALMKSLVYEMLAEPDESRANKREWQAFQWAGKQLDAGEGVESFLEKRDPRWKNRKADVDASPIGASKT
jgi:enoyl-CoA hydratase/carnithine racemase